MRLTLAERVFRKIRIAENGCWEWLGSRMRNGYGRVNVARKTPPVHRVVYEMFNGPVPAHLDMDHLCRNRACANPEHLEPVARSENLRRGGVARNRERVQLGSSPSTLRLPRTHCAAGHELTSENTGAKGTCLVCKRERYRVNHGGTVLPYVGKRTHCPQGHAYDEANTGRINGERYCRACHRIRAAVKRNRKPNTSLS